MRKLLWLVGTLLLLSQLGWAQQSGSLGEVARRVRAERAKNKPAKKVPYYTNDNLPRTGTISLTGSRRPKATSTKAGAAKEGDKAAADKAGAEKKKEDDCDEQCWRGKFTAKRGQIKEAEKELDILQRERNLARTQHYRDPNQAVREQYSSNTAGGRELQDIQNKITAKQQDIEKLKRELQDLEGDLRRAGKPAGWGRDTSAG